jgi:hypothetical protein
MDKALKQKYKTDFATLTGLINSFDPCGLISGDAQSDEYDCMTQQLLSSLSNNKTRLEMKDLILHEIEHHFGTPDLETLEEPYKSQFYNDLDKFLDNLNDKFYKNDNSTTA